jgi:hypothetical protein
MNQEKPYTNLLTLTLRSSTLLSLLLLTTSLAYEVIFHSFHFDPSIVLHHITFSSKIGVAAGISFSLGFWMLSKLYIDRRHSKPRNSSDRPYTNENEHQNKKTKLNHIKISLRISFYLILNYLITLISISLIALSLGILTTEDADRPFSAQSEGLQSPT